MTLDNVVVTDNTASQGGGLRSNSTVTVTNSTFSNNETTSLDGGGISSSSSGSFINVTVSGNESVRSGGGIQVTGGLNTFENVTVSGNTAVVEGGGVILNSGTITFDSATATENTAGSGAGLESNAGSFTVTDSIIAGNNGGDVTGNFTSGGNNIIGNDPGDGSDRNGFSAANGDLLDETGLSLGGLAAVSYTHLTLPTIYSV